MSGTVKVRFGNYNFDPAKDADLQLEKIPRSEVQIRMHWNDLFKEALGIIFGKIKGFTNGVLDLKVRDFADDFIATEMAPLGGHRLPQGTPALSSGYRSNGGCGAGPVRPRHRWHGRS